MLNLQVPQRGQHSPSGTVALAQGIRGHEISRQIVAEFYERNTKISPDLVTISKHRIMYIKGLFGS